MKATSHIAPFGLRMQPSLREALEAKCERSGRSLNAEIVARLEKSLADDDADIRSILREELKLFFAEK